MGKNINSENTQPEHETEYIVSAPLGLRLREEPDGKTLVILPNESGVFGLPREEAAEWLEVWTGKLHGWVKAEFLRPAEGA